MAFGRDGALAQDTTKTFEGPPPPELVEEEQPIYDLRSPQVLFFEASKIQPKDPQAALVFSLLVPGLGHLYSESYLRGLVLLAGFGGALGGIIINGKIDPDEKSIRNPQGLNLSLGLAAAIYAFAAQDARARARAYNRKRGFRFAVTARGPTLSLEFRL